MTDSQALILIDCIVSNAIEKLMGEKSREGYFEGIVTAIASVIEVKGTRD